MTNLFLAALGGAGGTPADRAKRLREAEFRFWYADKAKALGLDQDPDNPEHHYDYRAAFEAGAEPGEDGHWPSEFKAPDHPNRVVDGIDTITGKPANAFTITLARQSRIAAAVKAGDQQARELGVSDETPEDVGAAELTKEALKRAGNSGGGFLLGLAERAKPAFENPIVRAAAGPVATKVMDDLIEPGTRRELNESLEAKKQELIDRAVAHDKGGTVATILGGADVAGGAAASLIPSVGVIGRLPQVARIANPVLRATAAGTAAAGEGAIQGYGDTAGLSKEEQVKGILLNAALAGLPGAAAAAPGADSVLRRPLAELFGPKARVEAPAPVPAPIPTPEEAKVAAIAKTLTEPIPAPRALEGKRGVAYTPTGEEVPFKWAVRDLDQLETSHDTNLNLNPRFPAEAQPRDRSRVASAAQIQQIAANHNPDLLAGSPTTDAGAPLVVKREGENPFVVSGNGRTIASRLAFDEPHKADRYWTSLLDRADEIGIPRDILEDARAAGMKRPFLVREVDGPVDPVKLAEESNVSTSAALSATEQARADGRKMTVDLLDQFQPNEAGDVAAPTNLAFVRAFMERVVSPAEAGRMVDASGGLSIDGKRRIQGALFAAAYDDADALGRVFESTDSNVKNIGNALLAEAPRMARTRAAIAAGELHPLDASPDIAPAMRKLSELRAKGEKVPDYLSQQNLFNPELSPESLEFLRIFDENKRSTSRVASILRRYNDLVDAQGDPRQAGLFGGSQTPTKLELLAEAERTFHLQDEATLFSGGPTADSMKLIGGNLSMLDPLVPSPDSIARGKKAIERLMASHGKVADLGPQAKWTANRMRLTESEQRYHEERAAIDIRDFSDLFDSYIQGLRKDGIDRNADDVLKYITSGLEGGNDLRGVPGELREVAGRMRDHVDELTGGLLDNVAMTKELRHTLDQNLGKYLRRTYEIHRDPAAWEKVVREKESWRWDGMQRFLEEEHPDWQPNQVENYMLGILRKNPEAFGAAGPRTDALRMDRSIFKARKRQHIVTFEDGFERSYPSKEMADRAANESRELGRTVSVREETDLPDPIKEFLGIHVDPRARYAESVSRMAHDVAVGKFWGELKDRGANTLFFNEAEAPAGFSATIPGDPQFNPLAGMRTTPEIAKVVDLIANPTRDSQSLFMKSVAATGAAWRAGKTVYSPLTHVRNALSWVPLLWANGHFTSGLSLPAAGRATKVLASKLSSQGRVLRTLNTIADGIETIGGRKLSSVFRMDVPRLREEYLAAVRHGVVGESARAAELARFLGILQGDDNAAGAAAKAAKRLPAGPVKKTLEAAGKVPDVVKSMYSMEDDVGKLIAWGAEQANYAEALTGKKLSELAPDERESVRAQTAELVSDLYPTHSKANTLIRGLQRIPVIADFPTYASEVVRVTKNSLKQGWTELQSDNAKVKLIGARRLGGLLGTIGVLPAAFAMYGRQRLGVSKDEEQAAREFLPPWKTNSDMVLTGAKGDGRFSFLDVSFVNPYQILREPVMAFLSRGDGDLRDFDDRALEALNEFAQPFTQVSMMYDTATDIARNKTKDGRAVYPEYGTRGEQLQAMVDHITRRSEPGILSLGREIRAGLTGEVNQRTGRPASLGNTALAMLTGTRPIEVDVPRELSYDASNYRKATATIAAETNSKLRKVRPDQALEVKTSAEAQKARATEELRRKVMQASALGLSRRELWSILRGGDDGGLLSEATVTKLLEGVQ